MARRRQRCTNSIAKRRPEIAFVFEIHAYFFFFLPESVLHHPVLAGPPTGTGVVALKDKRGLLAAEFGEKTTALKVDENENEKLKSAAALKFTWNHLKKFSLTWSYRIIPAAQAELSTHADARRAVFLANAVLCCSGQ